MKKNLLFLSALGLIGASALFLNGCKKDDTTAPTVTLNGSSDVNNSLNSTFTDPGATASDDEDGTVSVTVSGTVDKDTKGDYILTYSATDAAGNTGSATRTVHVVNDAESWAGTYNVHDSCSVSAVYNYTQTITTDMNVNNRIHFNKFADYSGNSNIYATISGGGNTIDIPLQTAASIGSASETHKFSGSGVKSGNNFVLTYTDENVTASASATCIATYTKQ